MTKTTDKEDTATNKVDTVTAKADTVTVGADAKTDVAVKMTDKANAVKNKADTATEKAGTLTIITDKMTDKTDEVTDKTPAPVDPVPSPAAWSIPLVRVTKVSSPRDPLSLSSVSAAASRRASDAPSDVTPVAPLRPFTRESYDRLVAAEDSRRHEAQTKPDRAPEGRLVDGQLKFDLAETAVEPARDPTLAEGRTLPARLGPVPDELLGKPLEEIDPHIKDKTFVVITNRFKKKSIHRFSASRSCFLLAPWNPLRRLAITVYTNQFFDYFIITTILVNCVFLTLPGYAFTDVGEYVFLAIYTVEAIVKITARGFIIYKYTYLRDAWNWLDFLVIVSAFFTILLELSTGNETFGNISGLRTFRVLRALRTVSIVPGLKTIIAALLKSMRMLAEVILLTLFCMMIFALFALQVYIGVLRQKCVTDMVSPLTPLDYSIHVKNQSNWYRIGDSYPVCGNSSGSGACPANYTCLPGVGDNPNFGYTSFDHFGWAMLNSFQLITLDYWEDMYNKIIRANGPLNIIFFIVVVFFGSFYLINLMLAVVSMSYEEEASNAGKEKEKEKEKKKESPVLKYDAETLKAIAAARAARRLRHDSSRSRRRQLMTSAALNGCHSSSGSLRNPAYRSQRSLADDRLLTAAGAPPPGAPPGDDQRRARSLERDPPTSDRWARPSGETANSLTAAARPGGETSNSLTVATRPGGETSNSLTVEDATRRGASLARLDVKTLDIKLGASSDTDHDDEDDDDDDTDSSAYEDEEAGSETAQKIDVSGATDSDSDYDELVDRNCLFCSRCFCNYVAWLNVQHVMYRYVSDFFFEIFITLCIVLNVVTMSIEHHGMSDGLTKALVVANYVFTAIFTAEAIIKLLAMSKTYFNSAWNVFDFLIVIASLVDLGLEDIDGLSVFRGFRLLRLLRVFKLAQTWSTMRVLLSIILSTLSALGNLTFILGIVIYIFAVIGMQLFSETYVPAKFAPDDTPRWNFNDFFHSLLLIFRILCGEWIEPLWDCMRANGEICMIVFLPTLVFGNFMVLNLFLALLLNSFASDSLHSSQKATDDSRMRKGWQKLKNIFRNRRVHQAGGGGEGGAGEAPVSSIATLVNELKRRRSAEGDGGKEGGVTASTGGTGEATLGTELKILGGGDNKPSAESPSNGTLKNKQAPEDAKNNSSASGKTAGDGEGEEEASAGGATAAAAAAAAGEGEEGVVVPVTVQDCFPPACMAARCFRPFARLDDADVGRRWRRVREAFYRVSEHKVFEYFILIIIFASSISLCFEDIYLDEKPTLKKVLRILNIVYTVIFVVEMLIKWTALGFRVYFGSFWTILDFIIVVISLVTLAAESLGLDQLSSFRSLRTLRALRPLRAISRWQGMKIVVNALMYAIPSIVNVLLVCLVFWLIFSIAGVQLFGGKFYKCVDAGGEKLSPAVVVDRADCLRLGHRGYAWVNSKINFDNVIKGYLALFQVATFEGWMEVMEDAADAMGLDKQPKRDANFHSQWYFVIFIICGSFFTLNLFIGVIIDNFNMLKKEYEGGALDMFLTSSQRDYYNTMKKLGNKKPQKTIKRPKNPVQGFFFDVSMSSRFELAIMVLILLNMVSMAVEHYHQALVYTQALDVVNIVFTTVFTLEAVVKIFGMRWHYFRRGWNVFDFIVVVLSIIGVVLTDVLQSFIIKPTLLRVIRVFRIGRVLRLIRAAKGIRKLLFALVISLPALLNIGMLLSLIVFIYAIFGMTSFGRVRLSGVLDDVVNFQTFANSLVLLFRLTTSAGWNDVLNPLMASGDECDSKFWTHPNGTRLTATNGDCGSTVVAVFFMVSFILVTFLVIINMYIAVILENFNQAHQQEEVGVTEDDLEMFYVVWERYDPHATQFIKFSQLSDFVAAVDRPLGVPRPNELALVAFDLPIYAGDRLHCLDVLTALVRHVLGGVDETAEFRELKRQMEAKYEAAFPTRVHHAVLSSTMRRKKEDVAARTLQRAWRHHRAARNILRITEMAMEAQLTRRRSSASPARTPAHTPADTPARTRRRLPATEVARLARSTVLAPRTDAPAATDVALPSDGHSVV